MVYISIFQLQYIFSRKHPYIMAVQKPWQHTRHLQRVNAPCDALQQRPRSCVPEAIQRKEDLIPAASTCPSAPKPARGGKCGSLECVAGAAQPGAMAGPSCFGLHTNHPSSAAPLLTTHRLCKLFLPAPCHVPSQPMPWGRSLPPTGVSASQAGAGERALKQLLGRSLEALRLPTLCVSKTTPISGSLSSNSVNIF